LSTWGCFGRDVLTRFTPVNLPAVSIPNLSLSTAPVRPVVLMFRALVVVAILALVSAFGPARMAVRKASSLQMGVEKNFAAAAVAASLFALPVAPVFADGAVSKSTVFRARNNYGAKIAALGDAAAKGNFAAFSDKKAQNAFDLFISASNAQNGVKQKETKKAEKEIQAKINEAVKSKNAGALKSAFDEFIKVADLKSDYKPGEAGQTDSSGYSPTWGTERQQIYQR